ncbi:MAG: J domain-containing protein [Candidatus Sumerlaeota bacterium]
MPDQNAYAILGLHKGCSDEDIKEAYVKLVKQFDPEKHTDRFIVIQTAYENLRNAAKRAAEDVLVFNNIKGRFLFTPEEQEQRSEAELSQRVNEADKAYADEPTSETQSQLVGALMNRSYHKVKRRLWAEAIDDWRRILDMEPSNQRAKNNLLYSYITLGYSYANHGLYDEALELWGKALKMNPEEDDLIHNMAIASEMAGKKEAAKDYWARVIRSWEAQLEDDPDDDYLRNLIIEVRRHRGQTLDESGPKSIEEYKEILKIKPSDFEAQYKIATAQMEEQDFEEATKTLHKMMRDYPKNIEVLNLLGWAYLNSGRVEEAFQIWNRSLAMDPKNHSTRENIIKGRMAMGRAFRSRGMHTQSLVHFKALLRFSPNSPEVNFEIGQTYLLKGDKRSAAKAMRRVLELDPKNREARHALSEMKLRA